MYDKLDRIREELAKARQKKEEADAKVKSLEIKLKEAEANQIVADVTSYNMSPEQLAKFLELAANGKLQDLLSGQTSVPVTTNTMPTGISDDDEDEEDDFNDEN